jgi:hypothetical protein
MYVPDFDISRRLGLFHFIILLTRIDIETYGPGGLNGTSSTFNNSNHITELPSPSLNISVFPVSTGQHDWYTGATYAHSNLTYDLKYIQDNGSCQQLPTYKWGFSFHLLVITMCLTTFWEIGTYVLWLDAYFNSRFDSTQRAMGTYRAVLDLTAAMNDEMGNVSKLRDLSNHQLKERIKKEIHGGQIRYNDLEERDLLQSRATKIKSRWCSW